jgi:hypothetical protein
MVPALPRRAKVDVTIDQIAQESARCDAVHTPPEIAQVAPERGTIYEIHALESGKNPGISL